MKKILRLRRLTRDALITTLLVLLVSFGTASITYYVQSTMNEIKGALPVTLAEQERDVGLLVAALDDVIHTVYEDEIDPGGQPHARLTTKIDALERELEKLRRSYRFNDLIGISRIHAVLRPAIFDIDTWLVEGIDIYPPNSPKVLRVIQLRATDAGEEAIELLTGARQAGLEILQQQSRRIDHVRTIFVGILGTLLVMAVGLVFFVIRQQRTFSALRESEEQNWKRANFDQLTNLPNRANFIEHLEEAVSRGRRSNGMFALLFIDLDRFKTINDTLGHDIGDQLIVQVGQRVRDCVRSTDQVARLGGDEFTVLLTDIVEEMQVSLIAKSIVECLSRPFQLSGHEVYSGASVGITLYPMDGEKTSTLLKNADMAMYRAKEMGRNTFRFFTSGMTERARQFLELDKDLRRALEQSELFLEYQPIYNLESNLVTGVEALMRWHHPQRGAISPDKFIPVAEETGLIVEMGRWALHRACSDACRWLKLVADSPPYLAVNVSMRQFRGGFGRQQVESILEETGFPAERLVLEITESLLIEENEGVHRSLDDFRQMGVELAVDDFGTGYSALNYLRHFPVSILKIDRSFVKDMVAVRSEARLVETIVALAKGLNLRVVAEGVETVEQQAMLRQLHCGMAQGYLFGRPAPPEAIFELLLAQETAFNQEKDNRSA